MRSLLSVLAFAYVLLVPVPALAQTSQDGTTSASSQYEQYPGVNTPVGPAAARDAVRAAIAASDAIRSSEQAQATGGNPASAAEISRLESSEQAQAMGGNPASAAEISRLEGRTDLASVGVAGAQDEAPSDLEELPKTGGLSPWWVGVPLLCAGGLLARRILLYR